MSTVPRLATYDDLLACSEHDRAELIAGAIVVAPAPLPRQANSQRGLGRFLVGPFHDDDGFGGPGGWWIFPEVDVRFGHTTSCVPTSPAGVARACPRQT